MSGEDVAALSAAMSSIAKSVVAAVAACAYDEAGQ
jgi:hypothetical protein